MLRLARIAIACLAAALSAVGAEVRGAAAPTGHILAFAKRVEFWKTDADERSVTMFVAFTGRPTAADC